jgi:ABC-2 type transport system permease protein
MKTFAWLLRREFWENKGGFFWAPVVAGGVFLLLNLLGILVAEAATGRSRIQIGALKLNELTASLTEVQRLQVGAGIDMALMTIAGLIGAVSAIVVFFYCLSSLYDERRDRSVLFWKSLPVSDRATVAAKVVSAAVVAPLIASAAAAVTGFLFLLMISAYLLFHGISPMGLIWSNASPFATWSKILLALPVSAVWALPSIGWLMFCSVWARSKPFLWAVLTPAGVGVMVWWFDLMKSLSLPSTWYWTEIFVRSLFSGFSTWMNPMRLEFDGRTDPSGLMEQAFSLASIYGNFGRLEMWIGAVIGIALLIAATHLRRWRDEG